MDEKIVDQILDDLYSSFEDTETQSAAILLFLKDQGIATEEKLAPYFEQAGRASDVRWRAARVRMASLLASAMKVPEAAAQKPPAEQATEKQNSPEAAAAPAAAAKNNNSQTATKADFSDAKQEPSEQKSEQKSESEHASEQKSRQASEPESGDANKVEKDAA